MTDRYSSKHIEAWRQEGAVVVPEFFKEEEIREIVTDFEEVFPGRKAEAEALNKKKKGEVGNKLPLQLSGKKMGKTTMEQFRNFENIPLIVQALLTLLQCTRV